MTGEPSPRAYPAAIKIIHWITALCVFCLIPAGFVMARLDDGPLQGWLFFLHESFGALVLTLTILRLMWKIFGADVPALKNLTPGERKASRAVHGALYGLLLATPILGWLGVSAFGANADVFGLTVLPALLSKNEDLAKTIFSLHFLCACVILALVFIHIGGALRHWRRGDAIFARMTPSHWRDLT